MEYIDSGTRDATHALGTWMSSLSPCDIVHFRFQSGYFSAEGLGPLMALMHEMAERDLQISCVLGSNGGATGHRDVDLLWDSIRCPRLNARVAIVNFLAGVYHPKVYHATRVDGSQAAYVGSANLTSSGVTGLNIEAGVILDTADGDAPAPLAEIATAVDAWFDGTRQSAKVLTSRDDVRALLAAGVLGAPPPPHLSGRAADTTSVEGDAVRLEPLIRFPPVASSPQQSPARPASTATPSGGAATPAATTAEAHSSVPWAEAPPYILFSPRATAPTVGEEALTGSSLPGGAVGLVLRLSHDSARHFSRRPGTANVSIPVATVGTLRFGIYQRRYRRPRCEFRLRMRYVFAAGVHMVEVVNTNIMVYGHASGETGHGDIRMVIPAGPARAIREFASNMGLRVPTAGDPMVLEWPTYAEPMFRATFAEGNSALYGLLRSTLSSATSSGQDVGVGACWLPPGVTPSWEPN